jgi:hypothetical protein
LQEAGHTGLFQWRSVLAPEAVFLMAEIAVELL